MLERPPRQGRAAAQRQELQVAMDQLPEAGAEARHVLPGRRGYRHEPSRQAGQQVVSHRAAPAGPDRQRGEELLELVPEEACRGQVRGGRATSRGLRRQRRQRQPEPQRGQQPGAPQPGGELRLLLRAGRLVLGRRLELPHRHGARCGRAAARARAPQGHVRRLARHGLRHQPDGAGSRRRRLRRDEREQHGGAGAEPPGLRRFASRARRWRHLLGFRRGAGPGGRADRRVLRSALHERVPWDQLRHQLPRVPSFRQFVPKRSVFCR